MKSSKALTKWGLFITLSFIWGSSFELMKIGLYENHDLSKPILTPWQLAAIRLVSAGLVVIPFIGFAMKKVKKEQLGYVVFAGVRRANGTQGLQILVQSEKHPVFVEQRIDAFLLELKVIFNYYLLL